MWTQTSLNAIYLAEAGHEVKKAIIGYIFGTWNRILSLINMVQGDSFCIKVTLEFRTPFALR